MTIYQMVFNAAFGTNTNKNDHLGEHCLEF